MDIYSSAHFGVPGQLRDAVIEAIRTRLQTFDKERYRVSDVRVEGDEGDSITITLLMASKDVAEADTDAEAAAEAISELLRVSESGSHLRERQRELTLA
jgi:hypothetical protein